MSHTWSLSPENLLYYGGKHNGVNYLNHHLKNRAVERPCYCCVTLKTGQERWSGPVAC